MKKTMHHCGAPLPFKLSRFQPSFGGVDTAPWLVLMSPASLAALDGLFGLKAPSILSLDARASGVTRSIHGDGVDCTIVISPSSNNLELRSKEGPVPRLEVATHLNS